MERERERVKGMDVNGNMNVETMEWKEGIEQCSYTVDTGYTWVYS